MAMASEISIIYIGTGWLVVDKPAGISVHNLPGQDLLSILKIQLKTDHLYAINRLDIVTSGLIMLATSPEAINRVKALSLDDRLKKTYRALVRREPGSLHPGTHGIWNTPLTNEAEGQNHPSGNLEKRIPCQTNFLVESAEKKFALLSLVAITGRKHQLRRHCVLAGHPIVGDIRYGGKNEKWRDYHRIALHSAKLELIDPDNGQSLCLESPLPADFFPTIGTRDLFISSI